MLDIETTHKLASFLEAKLSLKNTTEIPRPVHGPLQFLLELLDDRGKDQFGFFLHG